MKNADLIWMNGEFVAWDDAKIHVLTHGLHYGTGILEGVRCYDSEIGPAVFRHQDHIDRMFYGSEMYFMEIPYSKEQIRKATLELIGRNNLRACYIRPLVYRGYGTMGLFPLEAPVDVAIAVWEWGSYLGDDGKANGIRAKVVSWRRSSPDAFIPHAKATGPYLNSVLAKCEAHHAGYEEAILLDDKGYVCEGSGENIYLVREGKIVTPPQSGSILDGITRKAVLQIARDLGYEVQERQVGRGELYLAEEVFVTGTAAELTPLREIDDRRVGDGRPGEITLALQTAFEDALYGRSAQYHEWLDPVPAFAKVEA